MTRERQQYEDEIQKDLSRYKDLLSLREQEINSIKGEYKRVLKSNEDIKRQIDKLERENNEYN